MTMNEYELERQRRIEENKARMAQLGLAQTVADIQDTAAATNKKAREFKERTSRKASPGGSNSVAALSPSAPRRRSGRLQGQPPELEDEIDDNDGLVAGAQREGAAEVYGTTQLRALGSYKKEWECFVDGYDKDGNRIYDKESGITCHQCRQKTLGRRTTCSECKSLQGNFCGDCLFMRYGENLDEATVNPNWTCPNCRDLCNCSFHRTRRGWTPTGSAYRLVVSLGFSSVAHYLVLSNLAPEAREEGLLLMPADLAVQVREEMTKAEAEGTGKETEMEEVKGRGKRAAEHDAAVIEVGGSPGTRRRQQRKELQGAAS